MRLLSIWIALAIAILVGVGTAAPKSALAQRLAARDALYREHLPEAVAIVNRLVNQTELRLERLPT